MLSQCKEEVLYYSPISIWRWFPREKWKEKKNPTAQPFRSTIVMQEENLLASSSSLSSTVGRALGEVEAWEEKKVWGGVSYLRPICPKMVHLWYPPTTRVWHDLSRMCLFVDYLDPQMAISLGHASSTQPWDGGESSSGPQSPFVVAWVGSGKTGVIASHRASSTRIPSLPPHAHSCSPYWIGSVIYIQHIFTEHLPEVAVNLGWPW